MFKNAKVSSIAGDQILYLEFIPDYMNVSTCLWIMELKGKFILA